MCADDRACIPDKRSYVFHLDLSKQGIKKIPDTIVQCNKVESLDLSQNDLSNDSFPEEFFDLCNLKELNLSYNRLTQLPACICMFIDLRRLDISGNELTVVERHYGNVTKISMDGVVALAEAIKECR